jgi:hypothetical protein
MVVSAVGERHFSGELHKRHLKQQTGAQHTTGACGNLDPMCDLQCNVGVESGPWQPVISGMSRGCSNEQEEQQQVGVWFNAHRTSVAFAGYSCHF